MSCLSPVFSIYGVGGDVLKSAGSGAAGLFLFGIGTAVVWALVYAELGAAYPYAGGDYVGVGSILGPSAGFASLAAWAVTAGPAIALEAQVIATYVVDLTSTVAPTIIAYVALTAAVAIALMNVRTSAAVTGLFLGIEMLTVLILIGAGMAHPTRNLGVVLAYPTAINDAGKLTLVSAATLALGAVTAAYDTIGGNQAIGFGEELQNPHRNMGRVIVLAGLIGAVTTALPIIMVVLSAGDLLRVLRSPAPFSAFVSAAVGPTAARVLSAVVVVAVFNALIAQIMFSARLYFSIGRDAILSHGINRMLARVHPQSGAPRGATIVVALFAGGCCLLPTHILIVFLQGLVTYTLALVCLAVLVGRRRGLTGQSGYWKSPLFPLAPMVGLCLAVAFCVADIMDAGAGRPSVLILGAVIVVAVLWYHWVLKQRPGGWAPRLD
jgi:amino acid transporter